MSEATKSRIRANSMPVPFTSCRLWIGGYGSHGYGTIRVDDRIVTAPHAAFEAWHRKLEPHELVRHRCDWKPCVEPSHLEAGTQLDNMRDHALRGRARQKLQPVNIVDIRQRAARGESHRSIALVFGVSRQAISQILSGEHWSHIP